MLLRPTTALTDDGDRLAFAAPIDARRARREVAASLRSTLSRLPRPNVVADRTPLCVPIAPRLDIGVDRFEQRRRIEEEACPAPRAETRYKSFGAVEVDDEMIGRPDRRRRARRPMSTSPGVPVRNPLVDPERVVRREVPAIHQIEQQDDAGTPARSWSRPSPVSWLRRGTPEERVRSRCECAYW